MEKHKGPFLEKAHLYSVDKQQVSFIDIASSSDETTSPDSNQDTSFLSRSRSNMSSITGSQLLILSFFNFIMILIRDEVYSIVLQLRGFCYIESSTSFHLIHFDIRSFLLLTNVYFIFL